MKDRVPILVFAGCLMLLAFFVAMIGYETDSQVSNLQLSDRIIVEHVAAVEEAKAEARVTDLPDDGGAWHLSLVVHNNWKLRPVERQLVSWFYTHPQLCALRTQCFFHLYTETHPIFLERCRLAVGNTLPAILLQDSRGIVQYRASAYTGQQPATEKNLPMALERVPESPEELVGCLRNILKNHRVIPRPSPPPEPAPDETPVDVDVQPVTNFPPVIPQSPPSDNPWWLFVAACCVVLIVVVVGTVVWEFHKRVSDAT